MREDERQLLSKAALQKQIREEAKFSAGSSLIPLSAVTLLAILFTVIVSHITEAPPFFWGFLALGVLPVWAAVVYLGACTVKAFRLYRLACGENVVEIVTDRVCALTEEMELHRGGRYAYNDNACLIKTERLLPKKPYFTMVLGIFAVVNSVLPCSFSNHRPLCNLSRFSVTLTFDVDI